MKKQTLTFLILCVVVVGIVWFAGSTPAVRAPASNEQAIMTYLQENFGESKTSWLDDIYSIESSGDTVVVASRKARRNDALDMCEAVSTYIYSANVLKPAVTRIEIRYSGKIIARRNGQADHCG